MYVRLLRPISRSVTGGVYVYTTLASLVQRPFLA
jgi:hypothetical protein